MKAASGHVKRRPPLLDKRQQQEQAEADQTGKITAYLELADRAFEQDPEEFEEQDIA